MSAAAEDRQARKRDVLGRLRACEPVSIREVLQLLSDCLQDEVVGLKTAQIWDGAWDELTSPRRHSFKAPAMLVSLTGLQLTYRGQQTFHPQQLQRGEMPPPSPQVRIDVAVTFVSAEPAAEKRAGDVLGFAEAAMPVLIEAALQDIRGANLYSPALYKAGMSAFALLGWRTVGLAPEQEEPHLPEQVRARGRIGQGELIWQNDG